ncbi:MAG TPA: family 78 glycoside hydrolase catalytic domain [Lacisediminihabitans sp.]|uniref:family 78 glycoside hydrolase catalytic domain n=1 Tax=Lacisediminihabitans sp. TaxID=2787631 RepID=UPI002ED8CDC0
MDAAASPRTTPCSIEEVRIEHFSGDVLGMGCESPRLSWKYRGSIELLPEDAVVEIRLRRLSPDGALLSEETVERAIASSTLCPWPFEPLKSREQAILSARVFAGSARGSLGANQGWSRPVTGEVGLLLPGDRKAAMVGPAWAEPWSDCRHAPQVRTTFVLASAPVHARLYLSAHGLVEGEVNGRRVGEDILTPGWTSYGDRLTYSTFDVTGLLRAGGNGMGFWLGDGWYRGRIGFKGGAVDTYGSRLGVWAQLELAYADGSTETISSNAWDGRWQARKGPIAFSGLVEGERYDARLEELGWSSGRLDETGIGWERVTELPFDVMVLEETRTAAVRKTGEHRPVAITDLGEGRFLLDFGQNCSQRLRLRLTGFEAGSTVTVHHAEVLERDGSLATRPLRRAVQVDSYTSNGQDAEWEPRFTLHGFRYAEIEGWSDTMTADDVWACVYGSDMERTGWFECSDPDITQLHSNVLWSMRSNFVSVPTDCPQRDERFGWTGDIAVFAETAAFLYDTQDFLSNWLVDVASETERWGTVPYYVPFVPLGEWRVPEAIAIWGDAAVFVPWSLYLAGGDVQRLAEHYPLAAAWVDEVTGYLSDDGVWDRRPNLFSGQLGDWLDPSAPPEDPALALTEKELVATAFFARSCGLLSRMAEAIGKPADAKRYRDLAGHVREGFVERFHRSDGTMTSDTQCAYALAIVFGLLVGVPDAERSAGVRLAELVRQQGYTVATGFAGTPYVLPALSSTGHLEDAYALLLSKDCPSWLYQVSMGATTTWERWDSLLPDGSVNPGDMTSFNHYALGSVAEWLHEVVGGLSPIEPGWKVFRIAPQPGAGIDHAEVAHETPSGRARLAWRWQAGLLSLDATVPPGTLAVLEVGGRSETLRGGRHQRSYEWEPAPSLAAAEGMSGV